MRAPAAFWLAVLGAAGLGGYTAYRLSASRVSRDLATAAERDALCALDHALSSLDPTSS